MCEERESHVNELKQKKEDLARNDRGSVVMSEYQTAVTMKMNELVGVRRESDGRGVENGS